MKITRSNYESYFLDFLEGNPDPSIKDEFQAFLKENPDLAAELETGDILTLLANKELLFDSKDELRKSDSDLETAFQERAVAYYEGDLSLSEQKDFEASLSENSAIATEAQQFGKLKLQADPAIVYENKEQLKKRIVLIPLWMKVASVAAMLLLAYLLFQPNSGIRPESAQIADNSKNKTPKNIVSPEVKVSVDEQERIKTPPAAAPKPNPAKVPAKQKANTVEPKPEKKVVPVPHIPAPEIAPSLLRPRGISFGQPDDVELAVMTLKDPALISKDIELAELLKVQLAAMRSSDDRELLSTDHLGLSGLQLVARLTGKRLTARKGNDGAVHSVTYNSRLLAFSIPVNR